MTPRSIRRAAERKAAKNARKAQSSAIPELTLPNSAAPPVATSVSPAKLAANYANAQLSSGPKTDAGKLNSSRNAVTTALTGRTVLLPTDDIAAYQNLLNTWLRDYAPATAEERHLVQSVADTTWRLERIINLEFGIFAKGSIEFADQFHDLDPAARAQMIQVETYLKYEKSLRNLHTQEARLHRRLSKDVTELRRLQAERRQCESELPARSASPAPRGFEFSNSVSPAQAPLPAAPGNAAAEASA